MVSPAFRFWPFNGFAKSVAQQDVPSRSSEFAHPDVAIGLTILAYRYEARKPVKAGGLLGLVSPVLVLFGLVCLVLIVFFVWFGLFGFLFFVWFVWF